MTCFTVLSFLTATLALLPATQADRAATSDARSPRVVGLAIVPARLDTSRGLSLLPKADPLTDDDAAPLYAEAAQALPQEINDAQVRQWLDAPLNKLPQAEVQAVLQQARTSLKLAGRAARCSKSIWPPFQPGTLPANLTEYRNLARLLCLRARLEVAQKRYDDAVGTIQTGLAMARHVGEGPTVVQGMVGVAIATMVLRGVEDLAQAPGSPNLHGALEGLPRPLVDLNRPISSELENLNAGQQYSEAVRNMMRQQMESSFERVRQLMTRLDGTVAVLGCIEALRHYAATHDGSLPAGLGDIKDVEVRAEETAFTYRVDGSRAVLDVSPPKGGRAQDAVRYEIAVAR